MDSEIIKIQSEKLKNFVDEMKPLLLDHYDEVHLFKGKIKFDPDYDGYLALDETDMLHCVTVRDDGKLVGYIISIISANMHYREHKYAVNDVLFLDKNYRSSGIAFDLIKFAENEYKKLGVSVYTLHMKKDVPFKSLAKALGLSEAETILTKYIGK